jgi:hypothetical protein
MSAFSAVSPLCGPAPKRPNLQVKRIPSRNQSSCSQL